MGNECGLSYSHRNHSWMVRSEKSRVVGDEAQVGSHIASKTSVKIWNLNIRSRKLLEGF